MKFPFLLKKSGFSVTKKEKIPITRMIWKAWIEELKIGCIQKLHPS
jgi:hypothetical protein